MKVEEMKVGDVIRTRQFRDCFYNSLEKLRNLERFLPGRTASDRLIEKDYDWSSLIREYELILEKKSKLSASERRFIILVGNKAFHEAVKKLIEDEKKADAGDGDNKK